MPADPLPPPAGLILVSPSAEWQAALLEMALEVSAHGELRYSAALNDFEAYLRRLQAMAEGRLPGRSPQRTFWAADGTRLVGSSRIRHPLTPELEEFAGHIGYDVRPACRNQGYGTRLLALTLEEARRMDLPGVWVNCFSSNLASARVILNNGGQLVDTRWHPEEGKDISRYWIDLAGAG